MIEAINTDKSPVRLSELTKEIANVVNQHFANRFYWVIAEITNHRSIAKNGYHYFDLSEKHGDAAPSVTKIGCTAFAKGAEVIRNFESYTKQKFGNNIEVLVRIKVDYSIEYGLRTILYDIDVAFTIGNLEKIKQQTLARLLKDEVKHIQQVGENIITTNKKLSYPAAIKGIALITSKESEAYHDFVHTLTANDYGYQYHLFTLFTKVQSETAADDMVECLKVIYTKYLKYVDAVVICRGGGAQTDFLTFNQYNLCRAVARFPVPIITGIGHHTNQSLVDLLVRTETKTPTKAAEFIVNQCHSFENNILSLEKAIIVNSQRILANRKHQLAEVNAKVVNRSRDLLAVQKEQVNQVKNLVINNTNRLISRQRETANQYHHTVVASTYRLLGDHKHELNQIGALMVNKPKSLISVCKKDLVHEQERITVLSRKYMTFQKGLVGHYDTLFRHFNIEKILQKGFAIIRKNDEVIADPDKINLNDNISVQLKDTLLDAQVKHKRNGTRPDL